MNMYSQSTKLKDITIFAKGWEKEEYISAI